jgi:hypothetical protein
MHPVLGVRGLLVEAAATNYLWNSNWVGGTTPTNWGAYAAAGGSIATAASSLGNADGAIALTFTVAAAQAFVYQTVVPLANETCTINVRVESVSGLSCGSVLYPNAMPSGCAITAWRLNGIVVTEATLAAVGTVSVTIGGTYVSGNVTVRMGAGCNGGTTGSATLSRPQFERASEVPTSYVPSPTGASAARTADAFNYTFPSALATALSTAGGMLVDFCYDGAGSAALMSNRMAGILYTSGTEYVIAYNGSGLRSVASMKNGVPALSDWGGPAIDANVRCRAAVSYQANRLAISTDGGAVTATTGVCAAPTLTTLWIGMSAGTQQLRGTLFRLLVWDRAPTDTELQAVSA